MRPTAVAGAIGAVAILGAAGWFGAEWLFGGKPRQAATSQAIPVSTVKADAKVTRVDGATQGALA